MKNAGGYRSPMSVTDALAQSPNTAFAKLISAGRGPARGGHGGPVGAAVLRRARHAPAPTTRTTTRASRTTSSGRTSARSRSARWSSMRSSCPMSQRRWPRAACGARRTRSTRSSTDRARGGRRPRSPASRSVPEGLANTLANALSKDHHRRHRRRRGRFGRLESADVGQDRHHRVPSVVGIPRLHQPVRRRELHLRRLPHPVAICARSRCASAATATCSAATSLPAPGIWR